MYTSTYAEQFCLGSFHLKSWGKYNLEGVANVESDRGEGGVLGDGIVLSENQCMHDLIRTVVCIWRVNRANPTEACFVQVLIYIYDLVM